MMARILVGFLLLLGIATLILVNWPKLVIWGLFILVVPGLLMAALPEAFLALLGFSTIWFAVRHVLRPIVAIPAAIGGAWLLFFVIGTMVSNDGYVAYGRAMRPDIIPPARLTLSGDIRLSVPEAEWAPPPPAAVADYHRRLEEYEARAPERAAFAEQAVAAARAKCTEPCVVNMVLAAEPAPRPNYPFFWLCDALCATLLATPGVTSVTVDVHDGADRVPAAPSARATQFHLLPAGQCSDAIYQPISSSDSYGSDIALAGGNDAPIRRCIAVERATDWPDGPTIALFDYQQPSGGGQVDPWSFEVGPVTVERLQVTDGHGRTLLRQSRIVGSAIRVPLMIGYDQAGIRGQFGWARQRLSNWPPRGERSLGATLAQSTNLAIAAN